MLINRPILSRRVYARPLILPMEGVAIMDDAHVTDYGLLAQQAAALAEGTPGWLPALANVAALLGESLPNINWMGFYVATQGQGGERDLVLGPFWGRPACVSIPWGAGVCGTAAKTDKPQLVPERPCVSRPHCLRRRVALGACGAHPCHRPRWHREGMGSPRLRQPHPRAILGGGPRGLLAHRACPGEFSEPSWSCRGSPMPIVA
jgi:hypothetical protein